jgi:hypothetical protein
MSELRRVECGCAVPQQSANADGAVPRGCCESVSRQRTPSLGVYNLGFEVEVVKGESQQEHRRRTKVSVFNRQRNPSACLSYAVSAV